MSDHNDAHDETLTFAETSQTLFYANECEPSNVVRKSGEHLGCYGESGDLPLDYNGMEQALICLDEHFDCHENS